MTVPNLIDSLGRAHGYLRLSITDVCNFRCQYCLPLGYRQHRSDAEPRTAPLSVAEISRLVRAVAAEGIQKIRLTGGEPTTRRDLLEIVTAIRAVPEIRHIALSTNGYRLHELAAQLKHAGLDSVNVSMDAPDEARFAAVTGTRFFDTIWRGIDSALGCGLPVKLNAVLLAGINDQVSEFLPLVASRPIVLRYIELMETGDMRSASADRPSFSQRHVRAETIRQQLHALGYTEVARLHPLTDGPASEFRRGEEPGSFGIIEPYAEKFCERCNRLRVTAQGELATCLFSEATTPLRHWLRSESEPVGGAAGDDAAAAQQLRKALRHALGNKAPSHALTLGRSGRTRNLSIIGG